MHWKLKTSCNNTNSLIMIPIYVITTMQCGDTNSIWCFNFIEIMMVFLSIYSLMHPPYQLYWKNLCR